MSYDKMNWQVGRLARFGQAGRLAWLGELTDSLEWGGSGTLYNGGPEGAIMR